ncbi:MAG TPA: hypothetical protein VFG72_08085 [Marmoricola sp.]|nr:hypothetical protein [Marmoricola sp.]
MKKTLAVLCAAMFALTACGGGDDDKAKENIKASLLEEDTDLAGTKVTDEQAGCVSDGMVDEVGVDKLQEYKLLDDDLKIRKDAEGVEMAKDDAEALAKVFVDCVDMEKVFEEQFTSGAAAEQLTDEQQKCLTDAVDADVIEDALAATFQGEEADPTAGIQSDLMACMTGGSTGGDGMELPSEEE